MKKDNNKSVHVGESGGAKMPTSPSNGTEKITINESMNMIAATGWYLTDGNIRVELPVQIVEEIMARVNSDAQVGMSMAADFFSKAWSMGQSFGSIATLDQFQNVIDDGTKKLAEERDELEQQAKIVHDEMVKAMAEAHKKGNQDTAEFFSEALSQLGAVMKAAANPNNTESLPFVTAQVMLEKLGEAFNNFEEMRKKDVSSMTVELTKSLQSFQESHNSFVVAFEKANDAKDEALWKALGLKDKLDEAEDKSTAKGLKFEEAVSEQITAIAGHFGDKLEDVGTQTDGIGNSKVGDHLSTVMHGTKVVGKIVFEDKAGQTLIGGASGLVSQLNKAMNNYGADAGIGIVNSKRAPARLRNAGYLRTSSNTHLVCVDWEEGDFTILDILYPIVREIVAIQNAKNAGENSSIDSNAVIEICEEALSDLKELSKLKLNLRNSVAAGALNAASALEVAQNKFQATFQRLITLHREVSE
jgi:hypothetical protein